VEDPNLVTELLAAGADARVAQQAVAGGTGSGEDLLVASTRVREAIEDAVRAASVVLDRSGHEMAEETARRIRTTLQAAVTSGVAERAALWRGTLDRDLKPAGFGAADGPDDDVPELAQVLQPLRRRAASPRPGGSAHGQARAGSDVVAQRAAQRAKVERDKAVERTRAIAATKRQYAERLAGEARAAAEEAAAAERAAEAAEKVAREDRPLPER
jgi:hypothetical protein